MNKSQALTVFNFSTDFDSDLLNERYEELVFEWKNEILRMNFSIELLQIKLKRLEQLFSAFQLLKPSEILESENRVEWPLDESYSDPLALIEEYENNYVKFKKFVQDHFHSELLIKGCNLFIDFQRNWENFWLKMYSDLLNLEQLNENIDFSSIKISSGTDLTLLSRAKYLLRNITEFNLQNWKKYYSDEVTKEALFTLYRETKRIQLASDRRKKNE